MSWNNVGMCAENVYFCAFCKRALCAGGHDKAGVFS